VPAAQKLILSCSLSPGDVVVMTAAVRELHRHYPGKYVTDVRTPCPAIWENNPHITPLDGADRTTRHISMHYDGGQGNVSWADINRSNQLPAHFLCGYAEHLGNSLGLAPLRPTEFKGDIHLSPLEKSWMSQVQEVTGEPTRFWLINAGGKSDYTTKIWPRESFQQVVDHFQGRLTFVQVGETGHTHPDLDGVIDLRGKTDLRQLIRLVYHASGILCGVTLLMHLAAAVESPPWAPSLRPCVVLGGGREPAHWEAYPGHQYLHTIGALPCCAWGGCWRSRTVPLGDGSEQDLSLCERPIDGHPECMRLITPERVIEAIELYECATAAVPAEG
jgi:ADP-heptose:LPS heptosyltransferase